MRVTNQLMANRLTTQLSGRIANLYRVQNQISSGKQVLKPSDDPAAAGKILSCREAIAGIDQYLQNMDAANSWLANSEAALAEVENVLVRARELTEQWATGTYSASQRGIVSEEAESLYNEVLQLSNSNVGGRYLFGGHQTDAEPFQDDGTYVGDTGDIQIVIGEGMAMNINTDGAMVFKDGVDIFATLDNLRTGLVNNDSELIAQQIDALESASQQILKAQSVIGARINRLEIAESHWTQFRTNLQERLSETEDVDLVTALSDLQTQEMAYEALLSAAANIIQPNLLQFLS